MSKPEVYSRLDKSSALLVFWRHAETPLNAGNLFQGSGSDVALSEKGIQQAKLAGQHIRSCYEPSEIISSPMKRTLQTLEEGGFSSERARLDSRFREIEYGELEGQPLQGNLQKIIQGWKDDPAKKLPGGESLEEMFKRVSAACEEIISQDIAGKTFLICSHATPIKAAMVWALGSDASLISKLYLGLASISLVAKTKNGIMTLGFNETLDIPNQI